MKHEIEGSDLRTCIDKAYDAGYKEALKVSYKWLKQHMPFGEISIEFKNALLNEYKKAVKYNENS